MKRSTIFLIFFLYVSFNAVSQNKERDSAWTFTAQPSLTFNQTSFSNWAAGGSNSLNLNTRNSFFLDYQKNKITWNNLFGVAYGISKQQEFKNIRKTEDKLSFTSKLGVKASEHWDYAALFDFSTQLTKGYNYPNDSVYISKFFAPAYFQFSLGFNYKPFDFLSVFISPIGARLTLVTDKGLTRKPEGAFGIYNGNTTLWQVGASLNALFKKEVLKNVFVLSKLDVFSNYKNHPENLIIGWENDILFKVNKYININLFTHLIHDPNVPYIDKDGKKHGARLQFKENFGVGFTYSFTK